MTVRIISYTYIHLVILFFVFLFSRLCCQRGDIYLNFSTSEPRTCYEVYLLGIKDQENEGGERKGRREKAEGRREEERRKGRGKEAEAVV